jgi:hypothetical protein
MLLDLQDPLNTPHPKAKTTQATPSPSPNPPSPPSNCHSTCQNRWQMPRKHMLEIPARMTGGMILHLLRRARHNDLAALIATLGS